MKIGEAIKEMRTDRKLSQKELAEMSGISPNALCNIEKGYSFPSKDTIKAICFAMDIPVSWLLFSSIIRYRLFIVFISFVFSVGFSFPVIIIYYITR